jgi:HEPN domain-containing protein
MLALDPPLLFPACFHAQQAAEKYLKALLARHGLEVPRTHVIEQLLDLIAPVVPRAAAQLQEAGIASVSETR